MCLTPEQISGEILKYLAEHPGAQDTVEGVTEWWIYQQRIESHAAQVEQALADLVARGLLLERKARDARFHYRLNRRRMREITSLLKREPNSLIQKQVTDRRKH